jgi:hypothetical protein
MGVLVGVAVGVPVVAAIAKPKSTYNCSLGVVGKMTRAGLEENDVSLVNS